MRYFLVDKVTELRVGERARGIKCVTLTDQVLHDHFPDHPIFPGSLLIEALAQLSGFLIEMTRAKDANKRKERAVLAQIDKAKFEKPAWAGDAITLEATLASELDAAAVTEVTAFVNDTRIARARLTFMMMKVESDRVHEQRRALYQLWTRDLDPKIDVP
jgi:3-hydroxyacyl-[acyl-carrier-protein] dehydratase